MRRNLILKINDKYNYLTVIDKPYTSKNTKYWICLCICGKITKAAAASLIDNKIKSCGCYNQKCRKKKKGKHKLRLPDNLSLYRQLIINYKNKANKRNISWNLTEEQAITLFKGNCYFCEKQPYNFIYNRCKTMHLFYNGIDRLDSDKSYSISNCNSCCKICNRIKSNFTTAELLDHLPKILNKLIKA